MCLIVLLESQWQRVNTPTVRRQPLIQSCWFASVLWHCCLDDGKHVWSIKSLPLIPNGSLSCPMWVRGHCRIRPPRFLAECCKRQLNKGSFVLLYFRLSTFSDLYRVCLSVFSCTVLFVSISQVIGCEDRLRNDLY